MANHKELLTDAGLIEVDLLWRDKHTVGVITLPPALETERHDAAIDTLTSLILAHACAGVDVESDAYVKGVNVALDAISNQE